MWKSELSSLCLVSTLTMGEAVSPRRLLICFYALGPWYWGCECTAPRPLSYASVGWQELMSSRSLERLPLAVLRLPPVASAGAPRQPPVVVPPQVGCSQKSGGAIVVCAFQSLPAPSVVLLGCCPAGCEVASRFLRIGGCWMVVQVL